MKVSMLASFYVSLTFGKRTSTDKMFNQTVGKPKGYFLNQQLIWKGAGTCE